MALPTSNLKSQTKGGAFDTLGYDTNANNAEVYVKGGYYTPGVALEKPIAPTPAPAAPAPVVPGAPVAPVTPTVGDVYKGLIPGTDQAQEDAYSQYGDILKGQTGVVDEDAIRANTLMRFQSEIDALNKLYAQKKAEQLAIEAPKAANRLGSGAAIQARRGLLGSDFGASQTAKVEGYNSEIQKGIKDNLDAELEAKVSRLMGQARSDAQEEIKAKNAARLQGAQSYIEFLKGSAERKAQRVSSTVDNVLYNGIEPDDATFKSLAATLGITVEELKAQYKKGKTAYDVANKKTEKAQIEVSPGASIYDPNTGKFVGTAPKGTDATDWQYVPATKYQNAGYFNKSTGEFKATAEIATNKGSVSTSNSSGLKIDPSKLSNTAQAIYQNPGLLDNYTPTARGKILTELANAGLNLKDFAINKVGASQRDQVAQYDDLIRQGQQAGTILSETGLKTGLLETPLLIGKATLGGAQDFTNYRSVIDNMSSALLKLRSGSAVTPQEFSRIKGFIPAINDDEKTAATKIANFYNELEMARKNYIERSTQTAQQILASAQNSNSTPALPAQKPQQMTLPNGTVLNLQADGTYK